MQYSGNYKGSGVSSKLDKPLSVPELYRLTSKCKREPRRDHEVVTSISISSAKMSNRKWTTSLEWQNNCILRNWVKLANKSKTSPKSSNLQKTIFPKDFQKCHAKTSTQICRWYIQVTKIKTLVSNIHKRKAKWTWTKCQWLIVMEK